ncbi:MAG: ribonucleoside triphosphate reductase, partial [Candidatus Margulisbacteria bacterium]|nr:ribonucleoside triphosphate reductase [Candidatus Margulisiibacteriota bacterium]
MVEAKVKEIKKRNGHIVGFTRDKITNAIFKAAKAVGGHDRELAETLTDQVTEQLNQQFHERSIPAVEEIQDIVEKVLIKSGYAR